MKFTDEEIAAKLNVFHKMIEENETVATKDIVELFEIADFLYVESKEAGSGFKLGDNGKKKRKYRVYFKPTPNGAVDSIIANVSSKAEAHAAVLAEYPNAVIGMTNLA